MSSEKSGMADREYSERFKLYAKSRGLTPDDVLARDDEEWPGGKMAGFVLWSAEMLRQFGEILPDPPPGVCKRDQISLTDPGVITKWIRDQI